MAFNFLIVDDSSIIRMMLIKTLHASGVPIGTIYQANHGGEALDVLHKEWVDMIFIDINMPVMDGLTLVENMQKEDILDKMPTVVVSTEGSEAKIEKLWSKGIKAFVRKPFTPEEIRNIIVEILGEWDKQDEPENDDPDAF